MTTKGSFEDADDLWKVFAARRCTCHRELLIVRYLPVVRRVAAKIWRRTPSHVELEELFSFGTFGLIKAVDLYDPDRGVKFETFAAKYIRGAILDEIRKNDWAPRAVRRRQRELVGVTKGLEMGLGRPPTNEEIAEAMEVPVTEVIDRHQDFYRAWMHSLDEVHAASVESELGEMDGRSLERPSTDPVSLDDLAASSVLYQAVEQALRGTSWAHRLVVTLYYFEALSLAETARIMGRAEYRVARLHNEAMLLVREQLLGLLDTAAA